MRVVELTGVDGYLAFDLDCALSVGGTRLAPHISRSEAVVLARAMTFRHAVLGRRVGGAAALLRATPETRDDILGRYVAEIHPLVERRSFLTFPDIGTRAEDLPAPSLTGTTTTHTALGIAVAAETALGGLRGRTLALYGFGDTAAALAAEALTRGARVTAVATPHGTVHRSGGLDVPLLLHLRDRYGDACVAHVGLPVHPPTALFTVNADILVPADRPGTLDAPRATRTPARLIAPATLAPYTRTGLATLHARGVLALPDFVSTAGADVTPTTSRGHIEHTIATLTAQTLTTADGPYPAACTLAVDFLHTWTPLPLPPPLLPDFTPARQGP
ncbi:Glu/Leu/Phe/Val dehydrogenase dimerization domain-containing protein [Sinosporangium siamense]|uniref:Glutamate/phenylalanine/leucine/valine/L-tryptophan dehydrogenase C-terminal domain-containing protein n=1 Tax=Sinosporangium siamense TaxID=1367973 RepID=A0A919V9G5_9ACTN|nr:Glu/Leu/Phe/Val dehydrogenase dimerization domain-containing protein [Sinosporangium siamense]GII95418.1 hypothetical protein Ssi02_56490 [Sinosporangium siamense]